MAQTPVNPNTICPEKDIAIARAIDIAPNPDFPGYYLIYISCPYCTRVHQHGEKKYRPGSWRAAHCDSTQPGYYELEIDWEALL
tara:strand:+ start:743 stop:994 length:252 start_codon:yes stop_codon:yes gene_type:complete